MDHLTRGIYVAELIPCPVIANPMLVKMSWFQLTLLDIVMSKERQWIGSLSVDLHRKVRAYLVPQYQC